MTHSFNCALLLPELVTSRLLSLCSHAEKDMNPDYNKSDFLEATLTRYLINLANFTRCCLPKLRHNQMQHYSEMFDSHNVVLFATNASVKDLLLYVYFLIKFILAFNSCCIHLFADIIPDPISNVSLCRSPLLYSISWQK